MRKVYIIIYFTFISNTILSQVGIGTTNPDPSSLLEINSTSNGILIPRVNLLNIFDATSPINSPANSLLVFNTNPFLSGGNGTGYYYWNSTQWEKILSSIDEKWSRNSTFGTLYPTTLSDKVGIGTNTPLTNLHIKSTSDNPVIFDGGSNLFVTLAENGINKGYIGSYVGNLDDINFGTYAGNSASLHLSTNNQARLTVVNNGDVGIGNTNPAYKLDISGRMKIRSGGSIFNSAGHWLNNSTNTIESAFIGMDEFDNVGFYGNSGAGWGLVMKTNNGNIGIGNQNPNAPLQFSNSVINRKIVLYDVNNNDHQYYGFGINGGTLRYQSDSVGADHVFFSAINSTSSKELLRVKGNGNIGIGTSTPVQKLDIAGKIKITDGSEGAGKVLVSDASGTGTWTTTNSIKQAIVGEFAGGGGSPNSTTFVYCNTYIDLPPGKWMVFGTYLLAGSTTLPSGQTVFVRTNFQLSDTVTGANPYVISGGLISGVLAGPSDFGIANGQTIIQNPNPPGGASIRFYMWAGIQKYGPIPAAFSMSGIGSSFWAENQLSAIPMN